VIPFYCPRASALLHPYTGVAPHEPHALSLSLLSPPADVVFIPASGFTGANIKEPVSKAVAPWYYAANVPNGGKSLFQVLDDFAPMQRDPSGALRLPIMARYKDMGALFCLGKLESGTLYRDRKLLMMPNKVEVLCTGIVVDEVEVDMARPGENVLVKVKGIEEEEVQEGYVLSYLDRPTKRALLFEATVAVLDLLEHKPIMAVGYEAMLHVHVLTCECLLSSIVQGIDKKTGEKMEKKPRFLKSNDFATVRFRLQQSAAIETFKSHPALGRFTIRDEGKTIAIGKITQIKEIE
jgi:peptide chain release factor subunit 3